MVHTVVLGMPTLEGISLSNDVLSMSFETLFSSLFSYTTI